MAARWAVSSSVVLPPITGSDIWQEPSPTSSPAREQRVDVPDRTEVPELVRVHDRPNRDDLIAPDLDCDHAHDYIHDGRNRDRSPNAKRG